MFKVCFTSAIIVAVDAIHLKSQGDDCPAKDFMETAMAGDYTREDIASHMEGMGDITGDQVMEGIEWAGEQGMGFEQISGMIEGAGASGAFDKNDIHDFVLDACAQFEMTPDKLEGFLKEAGEALGIDADQGKQLLEQMGDTFDISQEDFEHTLDECFVVGAGGDRTHLAQQTAETILERATTGDYTKEDIGKVFSEHGPEMTPEGIMEGIDWAAAQGFGLEEIEGVIEGAAASGAFDKHDIYNWAMDACAHFNVDEEGLHEMLEYAGNAFGISGEQGEALLQKIGEAFDISQEEFDQAMVDCYAAGAEL